MMNETTQMTTHLPISGDLDMPESLYDTSQLAEHIVDHVSEQQARRATRVAPIRSAVGSAVDWMRPFFAGLYAPRTWAFWRTVLACFCIGCIVGHWMEIPYCSVMDLFGIVEEDYAVWTDPWCHPYWVYGFGAVGLILGIEPIKERVIARRKTLWGAFLETWVIAIVLSMIMELAFGLIINQPDAAGEYPYWDNSQLPLNIFGQAWLVNDVFIGLAGMLVIWGIFPLMGALFHCLDSVKPFFANYVFVGILTVFAVCCLFSYTELGFLPINVEQLADLYPQAY